MKKSLSKKNSAILLVAGCSIGVGMLGIPIMTGISGFVPTILTFIIAWTFMVSTGFVLSEVALSFGKKDLNFIGMAEETLGRAGKWLTCLLYTFLFYSVMIAYSIVGGSVMAEFFNSITSFDISPFTMTMVLGVFIFVLIARGINLCASFNIYLMIGLFVSYFLMLYVGLSHCDSSRLLRSNWNAAFHAIPVMVLAFGYHNLVPSLVKYLDHDEKTLKKVIMIGSLIPLVFYIIWNGVMLGVIPFDTNIDWIDAQKRGDSIFHVISTTHCGLLIAEISRSFTFFAVATSFLPVALSFLDFLKDGFKVKSKPLNNYMLSAAVLIPPTVMALVDPTMFLSALNFGGGFCTVILFGILPAIMAFKIGKKHNFKTAKKPVLILIIVASVVIVMMEFLREIGM